MLSREASLSVLHLLNVGLRITEALDPVESSRESMFDIVSLLNVGLGNIKSLDRVESSYNNDLLFLSVPNCVLRVCGLLLVVVASMSDIVHLLKVGSENSTKFRVCGILFVVVASMSDIVHLLNVGSGNSTKSLDRVESSYNSDLLFRSVPNFVLPVCGLSPVVVLTGASTSDVVHLLAYLNVGLGSGTKWLDPVESSYNSDLLFLSAPNLILRFSGISLAVVLTGASTSDVVPLLNVSLGSIKSLDPVESSNNCDLLLSSFRNLILRVSGLSLIVREKGNGLWCVILEVNCEGEVFLWKLEESEFRTVSKL